MTTTFPAGFEDLAGAPVATLATVGPDGRPQVSAVWFLHEDGDLKVSLHASRQKTRNLQRNPAVNLFVLDLQNPMRYVEVRGDAVIEPDPDYVFADRLGAKYGGVDLRAFDGDDLDRLVVTIRPARVNAVDMAA